MAGEIIMVDIVYLWVCLALVAVVVSIVVIEHRWYVGEISDMNSRLDAINTKTETRMHRAKLVLQGEASNDQLQAKV